MLKFETHIGLALLGLALSCAASPLAQSPAGSPVISQALPEAIARAQEAARAMDKPDFSQILTQEKMHAVIPEDAPGDTSRLESLRSATGQGDTATPGYEKSVACDRRGDPECLAIQLLKRGALNKPELSESENAQLQQTHEDILAHRDEHLGELKDLATKEIHCHNETVTIPAKTETHVCDERLDEPFHHCNNGFNETLQTLYRYHCDKGPRQQTRSCRASRVDITKTEYEYRCETRPASYETRTCQVPVSVSIQKTYPYQCQEKTPQPQSLVCTETLSVAAIAACSANLSAWADLSPFLEVGWSARRADQTLNVTATCGEGFPTITLSFGRRTKARFTATGTATFTDKIEFIATLTQGSDKGAPTWVVTLTNRDQGQGTRTVSLSMTQRFNTNRFYDSVTQVCTNPAKPGTSTDAPPAQATLTKSTCTQGPQTRLINGLSVTRDCWQTRREYTVAGTAPVNECEALQQRAVCRLTQNECLEGSANACTRRQKTFECSQAIADPLITPLPTKVDVSHFFDVDRYCPSRHEGACRQEHDICTEPEQTRLVDGVDVRLSCWEREIGYSCLTQEKINTCSIIPTDICRVKPESLNENGDRANRTGHTHYLCTKPLNDPRYGALTYLGEVREVIGNKIDESACKALIENPTCRRIQSTCEKTDAEGVCQAWLYEYRCQGSGNPSACEPLIAAHCKASEKSPASADISDYLCAFPLPEPLPSEITAAGTQTQIKSIEPTSNCPPLREAQPQAQTRSMASPLSRALVCTPVTKTCLEGPATKIVNGEPITKACWKEQITYTCQGQATQHHGCQSLTDNPKCRLIKSECAAKDPKGECVWSTHTYRCEVTPAITQTKEVCTQSLCAYGFCASQDDPPDADLIKGLLNLELARQSAVYGDYARLRFFNGEAQSCRNKKGGVSCCEGKVRADTSNRSGLGASLVFATDALGETIKTFGSPFVYDVLSSHETLEPLLNALYGEAASGAYSPNLSYYGVSVSYTQGQMTLSFSPAAFFAAVAVHVVTDYLSCKPQEQALQLKRGAGVCRYVGSYCSEYNLGSCQIKQQSYCCFNSRLAKLIAEAAHEQLHLDWGTAESPNCQGITHAQFMALDFSKIDLTELIEALENERMGEVNFQAVKARAQARVDAQHTSPYEPMPGPTDIVPR